MQRTTLRAAGYVSILFGLFWIIVGTLGFIYLLSNGEDSILQNQSVVSLCELFLTVWYYPALKVYDFKSAPVNTDVVFWCVAILVVMVIFLIGGIKLIKYSNKDFDLKENVSRPVLFIVFNVIIMVFAVFSCTIKEFAGLAMYINLAVLCLIFLLTVIECIRAGNE